MFSTTSKRFGRSLLTLAFGVAVGVVFVAGSSVAFAKESRHRETLTNTSELRDDRRDLKDDRSDLTSLDRAVKNWREAYRRDDKVRMKAADRVIMSWVDAELRESRKDVSEAKAETWSSVGEVISEARDVGIGNSHRRSANKGQVAELRDDQRDLRDDRRDLAAATIDYTRTAQIAAELDGIQSRFDRHVATRGDYERKNDLLGELMQMAKAEVVADRGELSEDRRERREDRRDR